MKTVFGSVNYAILPPTVALVLVGLLLLLVSVVPVVLAGWRVESAVCRTSGRW